MDNKKLDNFLRILGTILISIGIPLIIIGVGIVIFSGLLGRDQDIGTFLSVTGVFLTSLILPILTIKLLITTHNNTGEKE